MSKDSFKNIPNWLRYILAIPFGILFMLTVGAIIWISNLLYNSPSSLWTTISNFIFANGINVIVFSYGMNLMLPKHQFKITLTLCTILGILYSMLMGASCISNNLTTEYIIAFLLFVCSLITSSVSSYKSSIYKNDNVHSTSNNKNNNASWDEYLQNNFRSQGTTTNFKDLEK